MRLTIDSAYLVWLLQHRSYRKIDMREIKFFTATADQGQHITFLNLDVHLYQPLFIWLWDTYGYGYAGYAAKYWVCHFSLVSQQQALEYILNGSTA